MARKIGKIKCLPRIQNSGLRRFEADIHGSAQRKLIKCFAFEGFLLPKSATKKGQEDLSRRYDAKPRDISALLRSSVCRGSDNTLCCHSLPLPFESSVAIHTKQKHQADWLGAFIWQGQEDSNPRPTVLETGTLPAELYPCVIRPSYYIITSADLQGVFKKY